MVWSRRAFLGGAAAAAAPSLLGLSPLHYPAQHISGMNLIPDQPLSVPNYWCTWAVQNYAYGAHDPHLDIALLAGDSGAKLARLAMTEQNLLSTNGWADTFYPDIRNNLYLLLDDGWETGGTATFELDVAKFPSFSGSPKDRLQKLNTAVRARGWRGVALWCRNTPQDADIDALEQLSADAGIHYWKIDIGDPSFAATKARDAARLPLLLEHVHAEPPVNGDWSKDGRFGTQCWSSPRVQSIRRTDVYRTYDVTSILSVPTTLDRLGSLLQGVAGHPEVKGLLNLEDEVYIAAAMGCTMGVMRHPLNGRRAGADPDLFFNGPRQTKGRIDEVARALRWQRIAPPFSPGKDSVLVDREILTDSWHFNRSQSWDAQLIDSDVYQGAPARITRNLPLPHVYAKAEKPFVFATRFPNGAVAVGVHERTRIDKAWYMPSCEVELEVGNASGPFGIFGHFDRLTLVFDHDMRKKRWHAQDLRAGTAICISDRVSISRNKVRITRDLINEVGLLHASPGDVSAPGLVIAFS